MVASVEDPERTRWENTFPVQDCSSSVSLALCTLCGWQKGTLRQKQVGCHSEIDRWMAHPAVYRWASALGPSTTIHCVFFVVWLVYWIWAFDWIWISYNAKVIQPAGGRLLTKPGPYTHSYLEIWITTSLDPYPDMFDRENIIKFDLIDWWEWGEWRPGKTAMETFYVCRKRQKWKVWSYCECYQWITRWELADYKYGMMVSWKCRFVTHRATSSCVLLKDIAWNCSMTIFSSAGFDLLTLSCSREKAGQTHPLWGKIYYHCGYCMSLNCCHKCLISAYSCFYRNISSAGAQQMMFPGVCTTLPLQQKPCVTPDFILVNSGLKRWYRRSQIYNHKTAEHIGS